MRKYRKVTMFVAFDIPDDIPEESQERMEEDFDSTLLVDLDNVNYDAELDYSYEYDVEETTSEKLKEENSFMFGRI
ncbi:hypothetical protein SELR_pSRC300580 (plasmid) [Selenomonas ruminantium subsp. lactilytica TAM6421]|uniref:Uncharacterized protein n=1 Tax=Selenomonas ruminantium subsp. lactilytica (strain NBRC 103574 / TAM6421) TaxID=927704 RepID=I0GWJ4_SELRL|nr:hypothetical protein [Selenomonas ruminantium]BAL85131.1 hypothetical protein SELR_pSRC300580 [Selenomonas ruminantium subsp. lactilytica TAM6421]